MDSDQKTSNVLLINELTTLAPMRLQDVFGLGQDVIVFEMYNKTIGMMFLVHDYSLNNYTIHLQKERIRGQKNSSQLVLRLKKLRDALMWLVKDENNHLKAIIKTKDSLHALAFANNKEPNLSEIAEAKPSVFGESLSELKHNAAQALCYWQNYEHSHKEQLKNARRILLEKTLQKKRRLLKNVQDDLATAISIINNEDDAKLLAANMHVLKKGMKNIELFDYQYDPPQKKLIELDDKKTPAQFLADMFNKIKKSKRAIKYIEPRLEKIKDEIDKLKHEIANIEKIDLTEWQDEAKPSAKKKKEGLRLPYRAFKSSDGIVILVGKSAKDNDDLSLHYAKGNEWWFHIREGASSHVVVKSSLDSLPERTFVEAAMLAAHFSHLKHESLVEVIYTRVKHLRKPKGLAPGKILVSQEKGFIVRMEREILEALLNADGR